MTQRSFTTKFALCSVCCDHRECVEAQEVTVTNLAVRTDTKTIELLQVCMPCLGNMLAAFERMF